MSRLARRLWKWTAAALAGLLILLAIGVGLFRAAVPLVPELRADAEAMAERALGWPVHIGGIDLRWALFGPELVLTDVQLLAPDSTRALVTAARLDIIFGPLDVFQEGVPRPSHVRLHAPTLALERGTDGRLYLAGYALGGRGNVRADWRQLLDLGLRHGRLTITDGELHYRDAARDIDNWMLRLTEVTLASDGRTHELKGRIVPPGALGEQLAVGFFAEGLPGRPEAWTWDLEIGARDLQLAAWYHQLGWSDDDETWLRGRMDVSGELSGKGLSTVKGEGSLRFVDLGFLDAHPVVGPAEPVVPNRFDEVAFTWRVEHSKNRLGIGVNDLVIEHDGLRFEDGAFSLQRLDGNNGQYPLEIAASRLPLAELAGLVPLLPHDASPVLEDVREAARRLAPRGELQDLVLGLDPHAEKPRFRIEAGFHELGIHAWEALPGVTGLGGSIRGTEAAGQLTLDSRDASLDFGSPFRGPLPLQALAGNVSWEATADGWRVLGKDITVTNPAITASAALALDWPKDGSPVIDLVAMARDVDLGLRSAWLPVGIMSDKLVHWLDTAIIQGVVPEAAVVLRGPLSDFPFRDGGGTFDIRFPLKDAIIAYAPGWPRIEDLRADVHFHGPALDVRVREASVMDGLAVSDGQVRFADLRSGQLDATANVSGDVTRAWQFLAASPLQEPLGGLLESLEVRGPMRSQLALDIPLKDVAAMTVRVDAELAQVDVHPVALPWTVRDLKGVVHVTERAVTAPHLEGLFSGHRFRAVINAEEPAEADRFAPARIRMEGRTATKDFKDFLPPAWLAALDGAFSWRGELRVPDGDSPLGLSITSRLEGVQSRLPAPLDTARPVDVTIRLPDNASIDAGFQVRNLGSGRVRFLETASGWRFDRGRLAPGTVGVPALPEAPGLRVAGNLPVLDLGAVLALGDDSFGSDQVLQGFDLEVERLYLGDLVMENQALRGAPLEATNGAGWELALAGPATGRIRIPETGAQQPWEVTLEQLHLPAGETKAGGISGGGAADPRKLPGLALDIRDLWLGGLRLGHVTGELKRTAIGYTTQDLRARAPSFNLTVDGRWEVVKEAHYTSVSTVVESRDLGDTLAALGYRDPGVDADDARFTANLAWHAAPAALDPGLLEGNVGFEIRDGSLSDVNPGAGRLIGLLSIAALPRRLMLDFSDFFGEGLSFDTLSGDFLLTDGNAYTTNVQLQGPSVSALLVGRTGLVARDYDQLAIVDPGVSASLPVAGYLAAGPTVGAALLLLSQLLKAPLEDITQVKYRITGSWDNPVIERVQQGSEVNRNAPPTDR